MALIMNSTREGQLRKVAFEDRPERAHQAAGKHNCDLAIVLQLASTRVATLAWIGFACLSILYN